MREHQVDPSALILEITETAAVADVEVARQFADRLTSMGCQFALDDFGAGFGSFYYLKHLLFDYVKTVAEFVSGPEVLEVVRTEGVDVAQGYFIGESVPYDEFVTRFLPQADPYRSDDAPQQPH